MSKNDPPRTLDGPNALKTLASDTETTDNDRPFHEVLPLRLIIEERP